MASVPTGGPPPPSAAATPDDARPAAAISAVIDLSSDQSKDNARDLLVGTAHVTAAVFIPGTTTAQTKVNLAATFGQKMSPVCWAIINTTTTTITTTATDTMPNADSVAETTRSVLYTPITAPRVSSDICTRTTKRSGR